MKKFANVSTRVAKSAALAFVLSSSVQFAHAETDSALLRLAKNLCEAAKTDDRSGMRKKLKMANMRLKDIYFAIQCGSTGSLLRVATESGSLEAATYISTQVGSKGIQDKGSDGKDIIEWTQNLVTAGDSKKQAFVDLFKSKI